MRQDLEPCFYLYRQVMGSHAQTGVVGVASCEDYLGGSIKKHELTRPDKEDDRVRHIEALNAQTGPVFLVHPASDVIDRLVSDKTTEPADVDFIANDGVRHMSWTISDRSGMSVIENELARIPSLYIADGHHRCPAAARVCENRNSAGQSRLFLSVIFPQDQAQILAYNRVLKDLNGLGAEQLLEKHDGIFIIQRDGKAQPSRKHELGFYLAGRWHTLNFRPRFAATNDSIEKLDVTLLQKYVLEPIFGITDPRTSTRINFVGGIRGTSELESLVNSGEYACAFSMFPTTIQDLMNVSDAGGIMPPKSTWFEPKLRDGMFSHLLS